MVGRPRLVFVYKWIFFRLAAFSAGFYLQRTQSTPQKKTLVRPGLSKKPLIYNSKTTHYLNEKFHISVAEIYDYNSKTTNLKNSGKHIQLNCFLKR